MRIYTKKGDRGTTGVLGGGRLSKSDARIRALGAVDEVNAALGLVLAGGVRPELRAPLSDIQNTLFEIGAALASMDPAISRDLFTQETAHLESVIDQTEMSLPPLTRFILPGGSRTGAGLHWTRTLSRRAESLVVAALEEEADKTAPAQDAGPTGRPAARILPDRIPLVTWMNRLSDTLFVLARFANQLEGIPETIWETRVRKKG